MLSTAGMPSVYAVSQSRSSLRSWIGSNCVHGCSCIHECRSEIQEVAVKGKVADTPESRRIAWARMSLLVLYFNPAGGWCV
jgi:hypothetical protein